jgi:hypothetical protein
MSNCFVVIKPEFSALSVLTCSVEPATVTVSVVAPSRLLKS